MPSQEAGTQTEYSLSDIYRLEELKACFFDEKLRVQLLLREAVTLKEVRKKLGDLCCQELKIKPRNERINI